MDGLLSWENHRKKIESTLDALILVFSERTYIVVAFLLAAIMAITYPLFFQIAIGAKKISFFAFRGSLLDIIILTFVSLLFGMTIAMQLYVFKKMARGYRKVTRTSLISTISGVITSKACCLLPLVLFTIGATAWISFFVKYATGIRFIGLALLTWSLYWTARNIVTNKECCTVESQPN